MFNKETFLNIIWCVDRCLGAGRKTAAAMGWRRQGEWINKGGGSSGDGSPQLPPRAYE